MDWTASSGSFVRPYRSPHGSPTIRYFQASTAPSTAFLRVGELVQFDTAVATAAHRVARAQSTGGNGANLLGINGDRLLGVTVSADPRADCSTGAGENAKIGVALFDGETEFIAYTRWAGPVTSSLVGQKRSIIFDSTLYIWQIDSTNSTAALQTAIITDVPEMGYNDTGAQVIFKISLSSLVSPLAVG